MTWSDMFRQEALTLLSHEDDVVPTLERIRVQAEGAPTHETLLGLIEAAPGRQGRLEVVCRLAGWSVDRRPAQTLVGWACEVDELLDHHPKSAALDATILALVLKITRLRTAGYEAACLLADNLGAHHLAHLLRPILNEDMEADDRAARMLASLIRSSGEDWETSFRISQEG